ncbi:MAG: glycosyltransferase [Chitinophagia bacterium]|nr:glycosyltransferase [Chitinophagia bacterium]
MQAKRMGICLNMIVKDEAARLPRLLASLEGVVDACVVCDTGSSDDTAELVRAWAGRLGIPCRVAHHTWRDYATNRNLALEEALLSRGEGLHDCGWVMVIDADERIQAQDTAWKADLEPGCSYAVHVRSGDVSVLRPFLLDICRTRWVWRGRVHNWVQDSNAENRFGFLSRVQILTGVQDGVSAHPSRDPVRKAEADRLALIEELQDSDRTTDNAHRRFQLAYCCLLAGRYAEAAERMVALLQEPALHPEIRYAAGLLAARSHWISGSSDTQAMAWLMESATLAPDRWEAPFRIAQILRKGGELRSALAVLPATHLPRPTIEGTFWVEHDVYEWRLAYERAFLFHLNGRHADALEATASLLTEGCLPEPEAGFLRALLHRIETIRRDG